jgi:hypothetical protein
MMTVAVGYRFSAMSLGQNFRSTVESLTSIGSGELSRPGGSPIFRGSATAGERLAADALTERLSAGGWKVQRQPFTGHSSFGARFLVHVAVVIAATTLIPFAPGAALAATVVAALSLLLEQSRQVRVLSRLLPTAPSQNLQAHPHPPSQGGARPTIVLCAHYDTQRTGWCMSDFVQRYSELTWFLPVALRVPFVPETLAIFAQVVLASVAVVRPLSPVGWGILVIIAVTHVVCLVMLANWACGRFVPGAADNATGVAGVLLLAERWQAEPVDGVDLMVLLTGCEETGMLGAAAWASANRHLRERCAFLNLDGLGFGPPHYLLAEVPVVGLPRRYDGRMLALTGTVASRLEKPATAIALPGPTDGLALLTKGFRGLTVVGCQPTGRLPFWHQPGDTPDHVDFGHAQDSLEFGWLLLRAMADHLNGEIKACRSSSK